VLRGLWLAVWLVIVCVERVVGLVLRGGVLVVEVLVGVLDWVGAEY